MDTRHARFRRDGARFDSVVTYADCARY